MKKVVLIKCESYNSEEVYNAIKKGITLLGGVEKFINKNEKILLKPNLLRSRKKEAATTTHPAVFEAIIKILKELNYSRVVYGDSPGFEAPEKVSKEAGLKEVADKYGIELADFTKGESVEFPEGVVTKRFDLAKGVIESDAIISLPKMKTHGLTRLTGAIKNQLGCVYGLNKGAFHARFPDIIKFSEMLVDLTACVKPRFYIMDGIVAMEGNGPASGTPIPMGVILLSEDPVALDTVFAKIVNIEPTYVPTTKAGMEMGLGTCDLNEVNILGDEFKVFYNPKFKVDRIPARNESHGIDVRSLSKIRNFLVRKPYIRKEKCVKCGICIQSCPLKDKALTFKGSGVKKYPNYDYKKCIRCYCCQEMCPEEAIQVKTPILGKLFIYR